VYTGCRNSACDGKYTNWVDVAPRDRNEQCVYIRESGQWDISNCSMRKGVICEFGKINYSYRNIVINKQSSTTSTFNVYSQCELLRVSVQLCGLWASVFEAFQHSVFWLLVHHHGCRRNWRRCHLHGPVLQPQPAKTENEMIVFTQLQRIRQWS